MHIHVEGEDLVLNAAMVESRKIDAAGVARIVEAHREMSAHIRAMDSLPKDDPALPDLAGRIPSLEYAIQELWGFERDPAFHIHWTRPSACRCDRHLNTGALFGRPIRVVSIECPLHVAPGGEGLQTFLDDGRSWHELPVETDGAAA